MERRVKSGRTEPIPSSILKKTKERRLIDKTSKIKKEKVVLKSDDVPVPLPQGCTPLMYACQQADYKSVVEVLNKDPALARARDRGLRCALHYCASSGAGASAAARAACADRVLMSAPALGNARDADGLTPLHLAVVHGNVPLVQTLLAAGADVNAHDDEHHTVVHWATVCGEVGALRAVLAAGADAATPDQHGGYPLHYAAQMCGAPAATDHQTRGAALEVLRALVKEGGAQVDVRDADGRTPLLWAASAGSAAAVLALHQAGAKVDDADRDGLTALHCAAARGHTEALETLVGLCGARVDVADSHGCTPLHYAAALGHADATAALLQHGADAHRQDKRGRSPAHTAAAKGQFETVKMLGARGANLWLRNSKGDLPLHEAVASGRRELVKWLLDGRPSQVNATNHEGRTPLHVAAATNNTDLCRLLIDRGAEVNPVARSSKNEPLTPLDCATSRGHRSTAKYLQMHGGLPATKLTNTHIIIDSTPITGIPTRRVTSTKIDVNDQIFIEKKEILELSSPITERRRYQSRSRLDELSTDSESEEVKKRRRKLSSKKRGKHKKIVEQKSFSDGYETELEHLKEKHFDERQSYPSRKNRSKSEPSNRKRSSSRHDKRNRNESENSSSSNKNNNKKTEKRHKKKSRDVSSDSDSSSFESSDRRTTKRKGKRTSIHIEHDDEKQSVNIVKYKSTEDISKNTTNRTEENLIAMTSTEQNTSEIAKRKQQSETETDALSLKTNMIVTEAQIHVERGNDQGPQEITVTMDSSNNVSIETNNLTISHKNSAESEILEPGKDTKILDENAETLLEGVQSNKEIDSQTVQNKDQVDNEQSTLPTKESQEKSTEDSSKITETSEKKSVEETIEKEVTSEKSQDSKQKSSDLEGSLVKKADSVEKDKEISSKPTSPTEKVRKRSFQVLSGPEDTMTANDGYSENMSQDKTGISEVSFASQDEIIESKDATSLDHPMGEEVHHNETAESAQDNSQKSESLNVNSGDKRKEYGSTTASSTEITQSIDKSNTGAINDDIPATDRAIQQVLMENVPEEILLQLAASPKKSLKSSKEGPSSRKSSIYETESYKVLSDIASATDTGTGILKKSSQFEDGSFDDEKLSPKMMKDGVYGRVPSVSDNEIYQSEANSRRKRFRKKGRTKSRTTIRSKSENSERGYESSGMMDSGFEPSPRVVQRRAMSPRLAAYYRQRNSSGKYVGQGDSRIPVRKPGDKYAVDMKSVTQRIQTNMRRYYCERKIFHHLLELKRLQIRTSKTNEAVLVKRAIDEYNQSTLAQVGLGPYNSPDFSFSSFEKFLYDSLRKLQKSGKKHLDNLPEKPIDFDYGESELYKMSAIPDNPCLCTHKTHRCFHAVHAYTGIPCSAYIPHKWNHHTMPKPSTAGKSKSKSFLPKINSKQGSKAHVTLEVTHGSEKQLIALPAEKLDKNKRYYVTFTVKGSEPPSENDATPSGTPKLKSVTNG